ncbi:hypothetical protein [Marinospirillum alkaliphilum]|uniref:Uncharacterized protein n=1 Tax=Marinospirillum alkaliphilum DSM 21637 TaxID=1122209 RepID=A0A1K1TYX2_9GAMM|nr:hypothetical protein [Marinospirillum alkaliphilum]SFX05373.1 hypothetical protein SAMN02745752_00359 [Marinospirillum alkaliphilum DSM 21637]
MDSLILLSWFAYLISSVLLLLASWKLLLWLPFTLRAGVFLSQLAILLVPAAVNDTALAPAFIVLILDLLGRVPAVVLIEKALPLLIALVLAWPLALLWGWARKRLQQQSAAREAAEQEKE